jgi:peptidyl-prolyl cis-trans isomerase B (cyclophilin B)
MTTQLHTALGVALAAGMILANPHNGSAPYFPHRHGGSDGATDDRKGASMRMAPDRPGMVNEEARPPSAAGPVIVLDTEKGTIEIQTYPEEAPKTVANIVALVKKNFYRGQRFHRVEKGLLIQIGDPQSRSMLNIDYWGRGNSGTRVGVAEISRTRRNVRGAVAMAHTGSPEDATSQFYILLRDSPSLNGKFAVFGQVIKGLDVAAKIEKADRLKNASVRE